MILQRPSENETKIQPLWKTPREVRSRSVKSTIGSRQDTPQSKPGRRAEENDRICTLQALCTCARIVDVQYLSIFADCGPDPLEKYVLAHYNLSGNLSGHNNASMCTTGSPSVQSIWRAKAGLPDPEPPMIMMRCMADHERPASAEICLRVLRSRSVADFN